MKEEIKNSNKKIKVQTIYKIYVAKIQEIKVEKL